MAPTRRRKTVMLGPGSVVSHGIDHVDVARFEELLAGSKRYAARIFTVHELDEVADGKDRVQRLAARLAAKEAVLKAVGTGLSGGARWHDIEVQTDGHGRPVLHVSGRTAAAAARIGIRRWTVSLSHTSVMALASVIGCA